PHYRFERLFQRRQEEIAAAPYSGGICFTMTPLLNQLSLYETAQSFINPPTDHAQGGETVYERLFGAKGRGLASLLPFLGGVPGWGHYVTVKLPRAHYHARMNELADLLRGLQGRERDVPFHPSPQDYRHELLFFAELFAALSGPSPNYDTLRK